MVSSFSGEWRRTHSLTLFELLFDFLPFCRAVVIFQARMNLNPSGRARDSNFWHLADCSVFHSIPILLNSQIFDGFDTVIRCKEVVPKDISHRIVLVERSPPRTRAGKRMLIPFVVDHQPDCTFHSLPFRYYKDTTLSGICLLESRSEDNHPILFPVRVEGFFHDSPD